MTAGLNRGKNRSGIEPKSILLPNFCQTPSTGLRHPSLEEGAGKRCSECAVHAVHAVASARHPLTQSQVALEHVEVLLYVHRNRRLISMDIYIYMLIRDGSPGRLPRLSHCTWGAGYPTYSLLFYADGLGTVHALNSKHWFTTSFLGGRCRKAVPGVWISYCHFSRPVR